MVKEKQIIYSEIERLQYQRRLNEWADNYHFAAVMMSSIPYAEKLKYAEERFK